MTKIRILNLFVSCALVGSIFYPLPVISDSHFAEGCWVNTAAQGKIWCGWNGSHDEFVFYPGGNCCGTQIDMSTILGSCSWNENCKNISVDACGCTSSNDPNCVPAWCGGYKNKPTQKNQPIR